MDQATLELLKSIIPVGAALLGSLTTGFVLVLNTNRSLRIQNEQQIAKWERERKASEHEKLQEWFHDYAILGCIDPLLCEINALQNLHICSIGRKNSVDKPDAELPTALNEAHIRFFALTGATRLSLLSSVARALSHLPNPDVPAEFQSSLGNILFFLLRTKQYLLDTEITKKSDIYQICDIERFQKIGSGIDQIMSQIFPTDSDQTDVLALTRRMLRDMARFPEST